MHLQTNSTSTEQTMLLTTNPNEEDKLFGQVDVNMQEQTQLAD